MASGVRGRAGCSSIFLAPLMQALRSMAVRPERRCSADIQCLRLLSQHVFLDLAGRGLRQGAEDDGAGHLEARPSAARQCAISSASVAVAPRFSVDEGAGRLAPFLVRPRDHGAVDHSRVAVERALDLDRADVLAARDDDVLRAVLDLDIAVRRASPPRSPVWNQPPREGRLASRSGSSDSPSSRCCRAS